MSRRLAWIVLGFMFALFANIVRAEMVSVSVEKENLRSGPGTNNPVQWIVIKGYPLEVVSKQGNWIQVRDFEKDQSWIHAQSVNNKPHVISTGDTVNLRATASATGKILGKVDYGTVMEKLDQQNGWVKVKTSGKTGWISSSYVWGW